MNTTDTPKKYALLEDHPNPLFPSALIRYALPKDSHVTLTIEDTLGNEIVTLLSENQEAGYHAIAWDGLNVNGKQVRESVLITHIEAAASDGSEVFVAGKRFYLYH